MIYPNNMEFEWVIVITWRISEVCSIITQFMALTGVINVVYI